MNIPTNAHITGRPSGQRLDHRMDCGVSRMPACRWAQMLCLIKMNNDFPLIGCVLGGIYSATAGYSDEELKKELM